MGQGAGTDATGPRFRSGWSQALCRGFTGPAANSGSSVQGDEGGTRRSFFCENGPSIPSCQWRPRRLLVGSCHSSRLRRPVRTPWDTAAPVGVARSAAPQFAPRAKLRKVSPRAGGGEPIYPSADTGASLHVLHICDASLRLSASGKRRRGLFCDLARRPRHTPEGATVVYPDFFTWPPHFDLLSPRRGRAPLFLGAARSELRRRRR